MRRRLFNTLCLLSLVLAVAVVALWARSVWWAWDAFAGSYGSRGLAGVSAGGALQLSSTSGPAAATTFGHSVHPADPVMLSALPAINAGIAPRYGFYFEVVIPYWIPLVLLLLPSPVRYWWLRSRAFANSCLRCGYDVRGNPGRACPECGEATAVS